MTRFRALLASLRIPNAPSVVSNVWLGYMLGWCYWGGSPSPTDDLVKLISAGLCLYFAGNLANDWFDRKWDAEHRPERAIPAGLFTPFSYLVGATFLAVNGLLAAATLTYPTLYSAIGILILITIYTWLHKRTRWAVIPMGLCRAGLYFMGFVTGWPRAMAYQQEVLATTPSTYKILFDSSIGWMFIATHALGMVIYIAGLSLAARYESTEDPPHGMVVLSRAMLFLPLAAMSAWWMYWYTLPAAIALIPFGIWLALSLTRFRRPVPVLVSALLAGIPLIDLITAVPLSISLLSPDQTLFEQPILLATVIIPVAAFGLGRLLQRVAPAT